MILVLVMFLGAGTDALLQNLAPTGTATQKDTLYDAENAIDGDTNSFSHTKTVGPTAWWKLTFPSSIILIDTITIWNRKLQAHVRIDGVTVEANGEKVGTVEFKAGQPDYSFPDLGLFAQEISIWGSPGTDNVKVDNAYLQLAEVQVFGVEYPNIANQGTPTQIDDKVQKGDSNIYGNASKAVDGNTNGTRVNNHKNSISLTNTTGSTAWWRLTFSSNYFIQSIVIYNRVDRNSQRIDGVSIYIDEELIGTVRYEKHKDIYSFPNLTTVGSKITVRGGDSYVQLAEVMVFGLPPSCMAPSEERNLNTTTTFPVEDGTVFSVSCNEGYTRMSGAEEVTCRGGVLEPDDIECNKHGRYKPLELY